MKPQVIEKNNIENCNAISSLCILLDVLSRWYEFKISFGKNEICLVFYSTASFKRLSNDKRSAKPLGYVSVSTYLGRRRIRIKFSLVPHYNRAGVIKMNEIPNNKIARFNVNMTLNAFLLQSADGFSCLKRFICGKLDPNFIINKSLLTFHRL